MGEIFKKFGLNTTAVSTSNNSEPAAQIETFKNELKALQEFLDEEPGRKATVTILQISLQSNKRK